jgi:hypothetical protein
VAVLLFAILAIGLDDGFILAQAQARAMTRIHKHQLHDTETSESILFEILKVMPIRTVQWIHVAMTVVCQESGMSITVSTMTDVLAFTIGW